MRKYYPLQQLILSYCCCVISSSWGKVASPNSRSFLCSKSDRISSISILFSINSFTIVLSMEISFDWKIISLKSRPNFSIRSCIVGCVSVEGEFGEIEVDIPRDRTGSYSPHLLPKHQTRFEGFGDKILSLYARGMTTRHSSSVARVV